jgi:hypothetical protein
MEHVQHDPLGEHKYPSNNRGEAGPKRDAEMSGNKSTTNHE